MTSSRDEVAINGARKAGSKRSSEKGSVLINVSLVLALVMVGVLVLGGVAQRTVWRARAQSAADAAALAGVGGTRSDSERLAARNGAVLVRFDVDGNVVEVEIDYRGTAAIARAERKLELDQRGCPSLPCSGP